ncbi:MAG TPA: sigma-54 dependent transcriptional regulator [Anaerohalosphaeraceae bacterium]|nr:sigma-54-dependent Fis family transcriptional regulator [Phycisphaerae bacterium]HOL30676.1 sigma-54 dependent transcriptional regulator [Anaerohalosphaeraceae bacterium]HOM76472.1 sigma-54 dependent transcriptional regulator [Anaerohalosphaeraceae bacterium]HPC63408.1 sigma-54 dependent transcriptional regulator [Anaerohalosphaeraceae bacterium]HPO70702.1 sigma-54 dependent transcriptional regulator [Anaerohalosphaeraceae bacterium]
MKKDAAILIVEPDTSLASKLAAVLKSHGASVRMVRSFQEARASMEEDLPDLVLCATHLEKGNDGIAVLTEARAKNPAMPVILISSTADIDACKEAIKLGAYDYLVKPLDTGELVRVVQQAIPSVPALRGMDDFVFSGVVSRSPAMQSVYRVLRRVAPTTMPVLIEGESGTGKELTARAIHLNSHRRDKGFFPINCAGLAESLLESELFGHVKGAFTGAASDRKGLFQLADKGTLFLDEIGDMPPTMQAKLLRVLEDGLVIPVGGSAPIKVDTRFISATNHDLAKLVEEKKFRQDLYFRIKGVSVTLPPLRQRPQDIPELFGYFLKKTCEELGRDIHRITEPAMRAMMSYDWPGNIRQLGNVVRVMVAMCDNDTLDLQDLPPEISRIRQLQAPSLAGPAYTLDDMTGKSLQEVEREHIRRTLELTGHNRTEAAKILRIGERTLYRKIKEYKL